MSWLVARAARSALRLRSHRGQLAPRAGRRANGLHAVVGEKKTMPVRVDRPRRRGARVGADARGQRAAQARGRDRAAGGLRARSPSLARARRRCWMSSRPGDGPLEERIERGPRTARPALAHCCRRSRARRSSRRWPGASRKRNVIPAEAWVEYDCRVLPGHRGRGAAGRVPRGARRSRRRARAAELPLGGTRSAVRHAAARRARRVGRGARAGCAAHAGSEHGVHRLALPAGGLRNDRLRFLSVAPYGTRAARHGPRSRRAHRRARPRTGGALLRALHRTDWIGDDMSEEKLRLGGMALRNGLALFGPTSWAAAVRAADGGIKVASGTRPRIHAADRVPFARGVVRMSEMLAALPMIRRRAARLALLVRDGSVAAAASPAPRCGGPAPARRLPQRDRLDADRRRAVARDPAQPRARALPRRRAQDRGRLRAGRRGRDHGQGARALRDAPRRAPPARRRRRRGRGRARAALAATAGGARRVAGVDGHGVRAVRLGRAPSRLAGARALAVPGTALQRAVATAEPGEAELEVAEQALAALLAAEESASRRMSTGARTRRRLPSEIFDLPVEKMREGYYSDAYFVFTKQVLERDGHHPRVLMQVFQRHQSVLGGMDEAIAVLRECSGRARERRRLAARLGRARRPRPARRRRDRAVGDGDDDRGRLLALLPPRDGLSRHALAAHADRAQRARGRARRARQADPLLPRPPRSPPRADRRRLCRAHRRRDRRLDRRAGLVVGRPRHGHRARTA